MITQNKYDVHMDRQAANHQPLTPLTFLARTERIFPDRLAVVHGPVRRTWAETAERCRRLASALVRRGIARGDTVAVMAPNIPEVLEAHFGVPMSGGVLCALNIRLDAAAIAFILEHSETRLLITDSEFADTISSALGMIDPALRPLVVDIDDPQAEKGRRIGSMDYEQLLAEGDANFSGVLLDDEWQAISLNYTSGTTGNPKGVVYHHRGAYLNSIGNVLTWDMTHHPVYLWTLPMFHCNGWCFPWAITMLAGTHVCIRRIDARGIYDRIAEEGVTHLCGAPIVMGLIANASEADRRPVPKGLRMMTAGAAPPAAVIERIEAIGFHVTHVYGLTEVYGPVTVCAWNSRWDELPPPEQARVKARQGVPYIVLEGLMVADPSDMKPVAADGETMGEIMMRGNVVMRGYLKNPRATEEAFAGGWFHTGDLAVCHPDGYVEIRDRSKDIIISGGENISTIEVEGVLYRHPEVLEAAVVARPDEKWGETPCAFVTVKPGATVSAEDLAQFCRENLAHFKCPRSFVFTELPKTSTGKIQKFVLRDRARSL